MITWFNAYMALKIIVQRFSGQFPTEIDKQKFQMLWSFPYVKGLAELKIQTCTDDGLPFTEDGNKHAKNILEQC